MLALIIVDGLYYTTFNISCSRYVLLHFKHLQVLLLVSAEPGRVSAEPGRVSAEPGRVSAELGRVFKVHGTIQLYAIKSETSTLIINNPHCISIWKLISSLSKEAYSSQILHALISSVTAYMHLSVQSQRACTYQSSHSVRALSVHSQRTFSHQYIM